jgi:hypothetical protein
LVLSPEGERIAYAINETDDFDNRDVHVANADGSEPQNLEIGETGAEATPADWAPTATDCSFPTTLRTARAVGSTISKPERCGGSATSRTRRRPRGSLTTERACSPPGCATP